MDVGMICSIFSGIFFGFYWYTKRWERKEQKKEESRQINKQLRERMVASQRQMQQNIELAQLEAQKHQLEEEKADSDFIQKARYFQEAARYNHDYQNTIDVATKLYEHGVIERDTALRLMEISRIKHKRLEELDDETHKRLKQKLYREAEQIESKYRQNPSAKITSQDVRKLDKIYYGLKSMNTLSQPDYSLDDMRNGIMYTYHGNKVTNLDNMSNVYQSVKHYIADQQTNVYKRS